MRAAPKEDSTVSSAKMVLGDTLVLPGQLPTAKPTPPPQRSCRDVRRGGNLSPLYAGPYTVLDRGEKVFRLHVGERDETVSVDRLKPHTGAEPVQPAAPPKQGLPPHPPLPPTDVSGQLSSES
jgi:hypothetical protein